MNNKALTVVWIGLALIVLNMVKDWGIIKTTLGTGEPSTGGKSGSSSSGGGGGIDWWAILRHLYPSNIGVTGSGGYVKPNTAAHSHTVTL